MKIKTRIAPSPTGFFHIGTARTAYFNYLFARSQGGEFIVRIDDTDTARNNQQFTDLIYATLDKLGLEYDHTFVQSSRLDRYKEVANELLASGKAIIVDGSICSNYDLNEFGLTNEWYDEVIGKVICSKQDNIISSQIALMKADGNPTYNFATVVDDIDFQITDVIRGSDHISNTLRQIFIYKLLDKDLPRFHHIGLLTQSGKKISKRDVLSDIKGYWDYDVRAVLNYILKLGWNLPDPNIDQSLPLIDKDKAIEMFMRGKMRAANSNVDMNKLIWLHKKFGRIK